MALIVTSIGEVFESFTLPIIGHIVGTEGTLF